MTTNIYLNCVCVHTVPQRVKCSQQPKDFEDAEHVLFVRSDQSDNKVG